MNSAFKKISDEYINVAFPINNDLQLWQVFLPSAIKIYLEKYPNQINLQSSGFYAYDINTKTSIVLLKNFNKISEIKTHELELNRCNFFQWVQILSIVRLYNSIEDLLIHSIQLKYFNNLSLVLKNRKQVNAIKNSIQKNLVNNDIVPSRNNNKYLIDFIKLKSPTAANFFQLKTYSIPKSTWEDFFEFISIIRHIIVHNGMIVSTEERSNINSKFKEMFTLYFQLKKNVDGFMTLQINEKTGVVNIISMCNDFALNTAKFIFELDAMP